MIDTAFLSQLDRFSLLVHKRVTSNYIGPRRSIALGRGLIFKEHRIYAPGDDIRSIDWKVYGRTGDLYVKTYEEERNLTVHIIVDYSASMNFGKTITKFDYASMLGVGFAYLAMKENEKFQFSTFSDDLAIFQSKRGMGQLMAMVDHLNSIKTKGRSKIKDAIQQYKKVVGSRAMIVLISDFLIPIEEINEALYMLGDHQIKIVQVLDPLEKDLKLLGDFKLKDSETGDKMHTHISPRLRMQYQKLLGNHSEKIEETCNKLGMKFHQITTNTPIFDAFYRILE
jgi:uncharacterized protein (DUF58 family)